MSLQPSLTNKKTGADIILGQQAVTIGRKSDNTIIIRDDPKVSRYHAKIFWQGGDYVVEDLSSSNGSFVNNERLTKAYILDDGDLLQIGETSFLLNLPPEEFDKVETFVTTDPVATFDEQTAKVEEVSTHHYEPEPTTEVPLQKPPVTTAPPQPASNEVNNEANIASLKITIAILMLILMGTLFMFMFMLISF